MTHKEQPAVGTAGSDGMSVAANPARFHSTAATAAAQAPRHGTIAGDTWLKQLSASKHQLRVPRAWAVDRADALAASLAGVRFIAITDLETGAEYWTGLARLLETGQPFDRGFGLQLALPLVDWAPTRAELERRTASPCQLVLGGVLL